MTRAYRVMGIILGAILLVALAPVLSVIVAGGVANIGGCVLNEGDVHPCVIGGVDLGETLYTMFVLGWLMLVTLPMGALALLIWMIVAVVMYVRRSRSAA